MHAQSFSRWPLRFTIAMAWMLALTCAFTQTARAALLVDFADGASNVPSNAAAFVYSKGASSPQSQTYTFGSQGYTGAAFDTGAGVTVQLQSFSTAPALNPSNLRLIDRNNAVEDLVNDWATVEPSPVSSVPTVGLRLNISGLQTGLYDFSSLHDDTSNQVGVLDAQYSVDGGTTWVNLVDNASYSAGTTVDLKQILVTAANGLSIRYLAGGNLFGGNGQTTDTVATNRLMPLNSFTLQAVPEPSSWMLTLICTLAAGVYVWRGRNS